MKWSARPRSSLNRNCRHPAIFRVAPPRWPERSARRHDARRGITAAAPHHLHRILPADSPPESHTSLPPTPPDRSACSVRCRMAGACWLHSRGLCCRRWGSRRLQPWWVLGGECSEVESIRQRHVAPLRCLLWRLHIECAASYKPYQQGSIAKHQCD